MDEKKPSHALLPASFQPLGYLPVEQNTASHARALECPTSSSQIGGSAMNPFQSHLSRRGLRRGFELLLTSKKAVIARTGGIWFRFFFFF